MSRLAPLLLLLAACKPGDYAQLYETEAKAPSLEFDAIENLDHMGPTVVDQGVNFAVYSKRAERIDVLLFDDPESEQPVQQFEMQRVGDVWNLYVEGIGYGQHYGYIAWGPNWVYDEEWLPGKIDGFQADVDAEGNRFNPNKLLIDPYAKAIHRDHDWSKGSTASGPGRTQSTWAAASKSIVIDLETYEWSDNEADWREMRRDPDAERHGWSDVILYEVHAKGFTKNAASGVDHPGTYRGIGEKAAYFQDLGITAVELLPIHEKPLDGGYWGYNNLNYFAPELSYSSAFTTHDEPDEVIEEFKWMVDQLHQHDIEVVLDVVYNHTGEGGFWREKVYRTDIDLDPGVSAEAINFDPKEIAGLYSFRGLDNYNYYALTEGNQSYWNNTGVGNQTRPNNDPMHRLTLDSLRFYVEEMHVDGFRFDLAGILGEKDMDYNNWHEDPNDSLLGDIIHDPVMQEYNIRMIAEPWTAGGNYGALIGAYPNSTNTDGYGMLEWNAYFRDWWRSFLNEGTTLNTADPRDGGAVLTGSYDNYAWNGRKPYHSVNFITAHDGFTLYDLFSFYDKQNQCGVLNPVCCDDPASAWCDTDSGDNHNRSKDWGDEAMKRQMMRNAFVAMFVSHGTPMILGGDEWMRTQYGNNNAYSTQADNEWNWFRWGEWQATNQSERHRMHDFVRNMAHFRLDHTDALSPTEYGEHTPLAWRNPGNTGDPDWGSRQLMMHYYDDGTGYDELVIFINMEDYAVDFSLPGGRDWYRVADTQAYWDDGYIGENPELDPKQSHNFWGDDAELMSEATYGVAPRSIVIMEQR